MRAKIVAGIYIERDGATVVIASHSHLDIADKRMGPEIDVEASEFYGWERTNLEEALSSLRSAVRDIADAFPQTYSVAVAGFGPFKSLMRTSDDYGVVHKKSEKNIFKGLSLYNVVRQEILSSRLPSTVRVTVHTDAQSFTLGEAINRQNERNHILVGIIATEDIGGGIVRGNSTFQSALHPEFGLTLPRFNADDFLKPPSGDRVFSKGIGKLASNAAMRERYAHEQKEEIDPRTVRDHDLFQWKDPKHWDFRAYYLAQLAFSVAGLLAPHGIVVASDLDPRKSLARDVNRYFTDLSEAREREREAMPDYEELTRPTFITSPSRYRYDYLRDDEPSISVTGALGACLLAVRTMRGGHDV